LEYSDFYYMSEQNDSPNIDTDKTWLSSLLSVLGGLAIVIAVIAFFSGGSEFGTGLGGLAIAAVLLGLGRALDYLNEILQRLRRLEQKSDGA